MGIGACGEKRYMAVCIQIPERGGNYLPSTLYYVGTYIPTLLILGTLLTEKQPNTTVLYSVGVDESKGSL